jgi:hypothetical protein
MSILIDGSASVTINSGAVLGITSGTAVASTSGTSIDFTGIPSWVKRITVMFNGVSTNGTSLLQVQLGTSSGFVTSGYFSAGTRQGTALSSISITSGLLVDNLSTAADTRYGIFSVQNISTNSWVSTSLIASSSTAVGNAGGSIALGGTLDRVRITTVNGTDTFDAGSINILYE